MQKVWGLLIMALGALSLGARAEPTEAGSQPAKDLVLLLKLNNLTEATKSTEVKKLEALVKKVAGVTKTKINLLKGEIQVTHRPDAVVTNIRKAVTAAGFGIVDPRPAPGASPPMGPTPTPPPPAR